MHYCIIFLSNLAYVFLIYKLLKVTVNKKQSGAVEACWAHNPEVRRSKLRSAKFFFVWWVFAAADFQLSGWPSGLRRQTQGTALLPW